MSPRSKKVLSVKCGNHPFGGGKTSRQTKLLSMPFGARLIVENDRTRVAQMGMRPRRWLTTRTVDAIYCRCRPGFQEKVIPDFSPFFLCRWGRGIPYVGSGGLTPLSARDLSPRRKPMDDRTSNGGPDKQVPPKGRRGTLVVPGRVGRIIEGWKADLTSRSLRRMFRRGTLVVPGRVGRIIEGWKADLTNRSLRKVGGARLSCPVRRNRFFNTEKWR